MVGYTWIMYDCFVLQLRKACLLKPLMNGGGLWPKSVRYRPLLFSKALTPTLTLSVVLCPSQWFTCTLFPWSKPSVRKMLRAGAQQHYTEESLLSVGKGPPRLWKAVPVQRELAGAHTTLHLVMVSFSFLPSSSFFAVFFLSRPSDNPLRMWC